MVMQYLAYLCGYWRADDSIFVEFSDLKCPSQIYTRTLRKCTTRSRVVTYMYVQVYIKHLGRHRHKRVTMRARLPCCLLQ